MTKLKWWAIAGLAGLIIAWWCWQTLAVRTPRPAPPNADETRSKSTVEIRERKTAPVADEVGSALALNAPGKTIIDDLQLVASLVEAFRTNFPSEGNPTGDNAEITAQLSGRNHLSLVLIPARHRAINARGELCDRWGSPFFFHQLAGTRMEIRSAGPDQRLWTADDVVLSP